MVAVEKKAEVSACELKRVLCELEEKSAEVDRNGSFLSTTPLSSAFALLSLPIRSQGY